MTSFPISSTAINRTVNLLQRQVLCKATRPEAYLQNVPLTIGRLYLCGENDAKTRIFNFRSSKISLRLSPPKVTVLTVIRFFIKEWKLLKKFHSKISGVLMCTYKICENLEWNFLRSLHSLTKNLIKILRSGFCWKNYWLSNDILRIL